MSRSEVEWQIEATRRYLTDPEFFARVQRAVGLTQATCRRETGRWLTRDQSAAVTQACVYGLLMAEAGLDDIPMDNAEAEMQETAQALGMMSLKTDDI